ncbi:zinc ribbon domain-containing protein [Urbifossiella limnaea]|uniref:hypothetical protein n=1 Tax=Urbifossiella limnaea TaxID=2528023 RepID=UPI00192E4780|nr:hypothetical protein [Urbifossiella limnaea]
MLLTCPTCGSGLQVPDGTTAHVRCPACKLVFPAAAGLAAAEPAPPPPPPPRPKPAPPKAPEPPANRDFNPDPPRDPATAPRRKRPDDGKFTPEERRTLKTQFVRGMWGCRLIAAGYGLQGVGLLLVVLVFALNTINAGSPALIALAGVCGLANLVLVPIGLGLVLAGRPAPGLYRFGIAAAVAIVVHALLVLVVLAKNDPTVVIEGERETGLLNTLGHLVTKLDSLTLYLTWAVYPDEPFIRRGLVLDVLCGLAEMVRLILLMVTLAGVARGAGDKELAHRCVRAGGVGALGPAVLAAGMALFLAAMIETGGRDSKFGLVLLFAASMGVYAILAGTLVPAAAAARDAAEACEFPYQSQNFEIGD